MNEPDLGIGVNSPPGAIEINYEDIGSLRPNKSYSDNMLLTLIFPKIRFILSLLIGIFIILSNTIVIGFSIF